MNDNYVDELWNKKNSIIRSDIIVNPVLEELLKNVHQKRVVDLGCGSGNLTEICAKKGANIVGIDRETKWFPQTPHKNASYQQGNVCDLPFENAYFDTAYVALSYLHLTNDELTKSVKEVYRVLRPNASFIIADVHPTALIQSKTPSLVKHNNRGINYFESREVSAKLYTISGSSVQINYVHRSLSDYLNILTKSGFDISSVIEPKPTQEQISTYPNLLNVETTQPSYIIFNLKKGEQNE